jgi:hypothetical protein
VVELPRQQLAFLDRAAQSDARDAREVRDGGPGDHQENRDAERRDLAAPEPKAHCLSLGICGACCAGS